MDLSPVTCKSAEDGAELGTAAGLVVSITQRRCSVWKWMSHSHARLFATPWSVALQSPPSMGFSRQEYWSGLSFPSPGDLPDPGIEHRSPALKADSLPSEPPGKPSVCQMPKSDQSSSNLPTDSTFLPGGHRIKLFFCYFSSVPLLFSILIHFFPATFPSKTGSIMDDIFQETARNFYKISALGIQGYCWV